MNDFIKNKNKNNVPKKAKVSKRTRIVFICLFVLWTLGAILSIFTFVNDNVKNASADTIETDYTFNGSNLYLPVKYTKFNGDVIDNGVIGYTSLLNFDVSIKYDSANNTYSLIFTNTKIIAFVSNGGIGFTFCNVLSSSYGVLSSSGNRGDSIDGISNLPYSTDTFNYILLGNGSSISQSTFICELIVRLSGELSFEYVNIGSRSDVGSSYNFIEYGSNCQFHSRVDEFGVLESRTYFLTSDISDNASYQLGYDNGQSRGYQLGYDNGFREGENLGYYNGKIDGISEANDYTFLGLISSVIDVPIRAISSLFSFEIFGYDMTNFVFTLFTLCAVVTVVKLFF